MKSEDRKGFNFTDVTPMLRSSLRMEEVPKDQIKISKFSLYIPKWMLDDRNRKDEKYSLQIDQDRKALLIKPGAEGMPLTRKIKSGMTMPAIIRSKKLIVDLMGQGREERIFACRWSEKHRGYVVDFKSPLVEG